MFPHPIAILSLNRPDYLSIVMSSLRNQTVELDDRQVYLFQDSVYDEGADEAFGLDNQIACIDIFREAFPRGSVIAATYNLGVALNFDRAERFMFERLGVECAVFLEDDLELGKHYLAAIIELATLAIENADIAYIAAYGNHMLSQSNQHEQCNYLIPLEHKWAFLLTQRQWLRQKEIIDQYLDIVRLRPYRLRDHSAIRSFFRKLGYDLKETSQDAAKDVASLILGTVKLNTSCCFGRYIGMVGLHFTEEAYFSAGYHNTELYSGIVPCFECPTTSQLKKIIDNNRTKYSVAAINIRGLSIVPQSPSENL